WNLLFRSKYQLSGIQIAQRVGGKVTHRTQTPVNVLKDSAPVVGDNQAKQLLKTRIPGFGEVLDLKPPFYQGEFDFEPEQNVQVIGHFVRFDADKGGGDTLHALYEIGRGISGEVR